MNASALIVETARRYEGVAEFPGKASNPAVETFFARAGFPGMKDEVPWCAAFVGAILAECGLQGSGSLMARSYLSWGQKVSAQDAGAGDVAVMGRGKPPLGHVFIVTDIRDGFVHGVGGNQDDKVSGIKVPVAHILGFRRADAAAYPEAGRATVRMGSRGAFVLDLQDQLAQLGYFAGRKDGAFGALTRAALMAFQADADIEADGVAGPQTWAALEEAPPRPQRDVTAADLRSSGSVTLAAGDRIDVAAGLAGVTASVTAIRDATDQAAGVLPTLRALVVDNWPLLIVGAALVAVVMWSQQIKRARIRDAQSGANVGR